MLSTSIDSYIRDKDEAIWIADLSNGDTIYMDDNRPGEEPASAWLRLRDYIKETNYNIERFYLKFRSHIEMPLPDKALGYFFCKRALAGLSSGVTIHSFMIGTLREYEVIHTEDWQVPALLKGITQQFQIHEITPEWLIINPGLVEKQMVSF